MAEPEKLVAEPEKLVAGPVKLVVEPEKLVCTAGRPGYTLDRTPG